MTPEGHPEKFNIGTPWHTQDAFEAAMKYRSPVEIITGEIENKIENDIMTAVYHYDIKVDKNELIKALDYDRKQYEQGYEDAKKAYQIPTAEWVERTDFIGDTYYECTNCKEPWVLIAGTPKDNIMNFCPCCGAKMQQPKEEKQE